MRRKISLFLTTVMLGVSLATTGCGGAKEATSAQAKEVYEKFNNAFEATKEADSITINATLGMTMGEGENSIQSQSISDVKRVKVDEANKYNVNLKNTYKMGADEEQAQESVATFDYTDGFVYFMSDTEKAKEEITEADFLTVIDSYSLALSEEAISSSTLTESDGNKTYNVTFDTEKIQSLMEANASSLGQMFSDDESMKINSATLVIELDKDDALLNYDLAIDAAYLEASAEEATGDDTVATPVETPFSYNIKANFADMNLSLIHI